MFGYAYPPEERGLLTVLATNKSHYLKSQSQTRNLKHEDGSESSVFVIDNIESFKQTVIDASVKKPMIVMVHHSVVKVSADEKKFFLATADEGKSVAGFATIDLVNGKKELKEIFQFIVALMREQNIVSITLPFFLLFKNRALVLPVGQGLDSLAKLMSIAREQQPEQCQQCGQVPAYDITPTFPGAAATKTSEPKNKQSWWECVRNFFKPNK